MIPKLANREANTARKRETVGESKSIYSCVMKRQLYIHIVSTYIYGGYIYILYSILEKELH